MSNRFDERSGYSVSASPFVKLTSETERLRYGVHYQPTLFYFSEADPSDRLNHRAGGDLSYQLGRRTAFSGTFFYSNTETLLRDSELDDSGDTELVFERERRQSASVSLGLSRRLSRRLSTSLTAARSIFRADTESLANASNTAFSASLSYRVSEDISAGLSASVRRQSFDDTSFREGTSTRFFNLQATWTQQLDEHTTLSFSAGPLFVDPEELDAPDRVFSPVATYPSVVDEDNDVFLFNPRTCPTATDGGFLLVRGQCDVFDQPIARQFRSSARSLQNFAELPTDQIAESESDRTLTLSTSASLTRRWRHTTASLRFSRSEGSVDGLGTSTVRNVLDASLEWRPSQDWRLRLWGNWTLRDSTSDVERFVSVVEPGPVVVDGFLIARGAAVATNRLQLVVDSNSADATFYSIRFGVWRRLGRRWHLASAVRYQFQRTESDFFAARRDFENVGISFAITYRFSDFRPW